MNDAYCAEHSILPSDGKREAEKKGEIDSDRQEVRRSPFISKPIFKLPLSFVPFAFHFPSLNTSSEGDNIQVFPKPK